MHQQINFFQPVFRKQHKVFSAVTLAQIVATVAVLLLLLFVHAGWTLAGMESSVGNLQQQYHHLQQQVGVLKDVPRNPDTVALDKEILQLQTHIEGSGELLAHFDNLVIENQRGFHNRFRILTEQHIPDLQLEGITVDGNAHIEIRGSTRDARQVPVYLQQLSMQPGLSATAFATVQLTRPDIQQMPLRFVLRNFRQKPAGDWN